MPSLVLEDFAIAAAPMPDMSGDPATLALTEADRMAAYEKGYQAGWDDAAQAEAQNQTRIGAEFARNLQELSFTFHEARAHVIQAMEPLLQELTDTLLPALMADALAQTVIEELRPLIEESADAPVELVIAPAGRPALEAQLAEAGIAAIELTEEPSLAEGQAYLRLGATERQIDLSGALERIRTAIATLYQLNERTLKHA